MQEILYLSIAIGLFVNLVTVDLFGVILGGFVVPGYLALEIINPFYIVQVFFIAALTVLVVRLLSNVMIIYGRKMLVMSVLVGFMLNWALDYTGIARPYGFYTGHFGLIIPGLMAYWMQRQGAVITVALSITGAVIIRLILGLVTGGSIPL
jgi:poly-gamma-glutamate biosynthesis protein PgsC/CapC